MPVLGERHHVANNGLYGVMVCKRWVATKCLWCFFYSRGLCVESNGDKARVGGCNHERRLRTEENSALLSVGIKDGRWSMATMSMTGLACQ
jgi:hypothetical protein